MRCPFCSSEKLKVIDSRTCEGERAIRRRRKCEDCSKRFTTYERIEETTRLLVVKKDGQRKPWDKNKIIEGLERATYKLPVEADELRRIADEVEEEIKTAYDREAPSSAIGELVSEKLRRVNQVAYVRYASVYREFKTLEDLVEEAKAVIDARRYEDPPGQGRLFIEPPTEQPQQRPSPAPANGNAAGAEGGPKRRGRKPRTATTVPATNE